MLKLLLPYLTPLIVLGILAWRLSRQQGGRRLTPSRLWIRPAILIVFLGLAFLHPPELTLLSSALFAAAIAAGAGLGYLLASHQALAIDFTTGRITSKMSRMGMVLFIALFAARYAFRLLVMGGQAPDKLMAKSAQITMYTDVGLVFVLALVVAQAWELWRRTRPLIAEHAAQKAAKPAEGPAE